MAEAAARWLETRDTLARTVTLKLRYKDFRTITRSHSAPPTRDAGAIIDRAVRLVDKTDAGRRRCVCSASASAASAPRTSRRPSRPARRGCRSRCDERLRSRSASELLIESESEKAA